MMIGIAEKVLAAVSGPLIHFIFVNFRLELDEIVKLYSDTGLVLDEAMQEFIAKSREAVKASRQVRHRRLPISAAREERPPSLKRESNHTDLGSST
jgi:hypothetical protein